ncbi:four helix bundle protein [Candidatus Acetothermia bacterium]|nr:four helix bundle protein [Candidatus Acetothermia bacterium]
MKITKFEEIKAWQEARSLTSLVYNATQQAGFKRDLGLASQIQRAAVSVMANIAEGFETQQRRRFVNFLRIANASVAEVKSHLYVGLDQGYMNKSDFDKIYSQAQTVGKLIGGFIAYLQKGDEHTK